jgi:hypothetical protein
MNMTSNGQQELALSHPATDPHVTIPRVGMHLLLEAYCCTRELKADAWELAVELSCLRAAGLTNTQLRWLLSKGYALHRTERSQPGAPRRTFEEVGNLSLPEGTCLVLTDVGADYALGSFPPWAVVAPAEARLHNPVWDEARRELRVGLTVVKRFKQPAANQELVLRALQEEGWPPRIDDPLPPEADQDPKRRLHSTISNLNRGQRHGIKVHFEGAGDGESVSWRLLGTAPAGDDRAKA